MKSKNVYLEEVARALALSKNDRARDFAKQHFPFALGLGEPLFQAAWAWVAVSGEHVPVVVVPVIDKHRNISTLVAPLLKPTASVRKVVGLALCRVRCVRGEYRQTYNPDRPRPVARVGAWWWAGPRLVLDGAKARPAERMPGRFETHQPVCPWEENPGPAIAVAMDEFFETEGAAQ